MILGFGNITPKTQLGQGATVIFCLLGIPITMLALKSTGELLASSISFLVVKTETKLLKKAEAKHVQMKTFFVACLSIVILHVLASVSTIYLEKWSFLEGLYAWFITFTTIGFGDYVYMDSLRRKVDHGETSKARLVYNGILFALPYIVGLSLVSCILSIVLRPIYTVRFLLTIVACDFCSARCSRHEKIVYDFHDIKLPVATIVVGF